MENTKPCARSKAPAAARALGMLAVLALGGVLLWRRNDPRRGTEPPPAARDCRDVLEDSINLLGAIRGYCELAKMKGESGCALESRMNSSIATVDEAATLLRQILAACRRPSRPLHS